MKHILTVYIDFYKEEKSMAIAMLLVVVVAVAGGTASIIGTVLDAEASRNNPNPMVQQQLMHRATQHRVLFRR